MVFCCIRLFLNHYIQHCHKVYLMKYAYMHESFASWYFLCIICSVRSTLRIFMFESEANLSSLITVANSFYFIFFVYIEFCVQQCTFHRFGTKFPPHASTCASMCSSVTICTNTLYTRQQINTISQSLIKTQ